MLTHIDPKAKNQTAILMKSAPWVAVPGGALEKLLQFKSGPRSAITAPQKVMTACNKPMHLDSSHKL